MRSALLLLALFIQDSDYYLSLPGAGGIWRLDSETLALTPFVTGLSVPFYGVWATDGNLYIPDRGLGAVLKISPTGEVDPFAAGGYLPTPVTLVQAPDGTLVVSDIFTESIVALDENGNQTLIADAVSSGGLLSGPGGLGYGPDGTLYVSNNLSNTVAAIDENGALSLVSDGDGLLDQPGGLAVDGGGNLFIANYQSNTLVRIRLDDGSAEIFSDDPYMISPNDVRLSRTGAILSTVKNGALLSFDPLGQMTIIAETGVLGQTDGVAVPADHPPCDGRFLPYGSGLAGTGGIVPRLSGIFSPCTGAVAALEFDRFLGNSNGSLLWALGPGSLPFKKGTLHLDLAGPWDLIPLSFPGVGAGGGELIIPFQFPDDPSLSGLSVFLQVIASDPGAIKKFSISNALEERIGS